MHSTSNLDDSYIGSGKLLWRSIKKHGKENHVKEILEWFEDRCSLKLRERELVNEEILQDSNCMNIALGGEGGFTIAQYKLGAKRMNEKVWSDPNHIEKMRKMKSDLNRKLHSEGKLKAPNTKGRLHSEETKEKIRQANSISQKGSFNSQYGTRWITNERENKKILKGDSVPEGWRLGRILKRLN